MAIEVRPATRFDDVKTMVGPKRPDATVCWCLSYRIGSKQNVTLRGTERGELVQQLVAADPPPGVLAYDGDEVVGWAAVSTRARTPALPATARFRMWTISTCGLCGAFAYGPAIAARAFPTTCFGVRWTLPEATGHPPSKVTLWITMAIAWISRWRTLARGSSLKKQDLTKRLTPIPF